VPPIGMCHIAWGDEATVASYIEKAAQHVSADVLAHLRNAFGVIRRRGFAMGVNGPGINHSREATVIPAGQVRDQAYWSSVFAMVSQLSPNEVQLFDLAEVGGQGIGYIGAPVFSPGGAVAFQLVITGLPTDLQARDIERYAERLCATAASITSETHGRIPALS